MISRYVRSHGISVGRTWLCVVLITATCSSRAQWLNGYGYRKQLTINASQVNGLANHIDFPVLVDIQNDVDFRTTGNGGLVEDANGWDIAFTQSDGSTLLDHQIEAYDGGVGAGTLQMWVRIPSLSPSVNTIIYIYFGNAAVAADPSLTSTWNNNCEGVWHIHDDFDDGTANGNNLTNNGSTNLAAVIADGQSYDGTNDSDIAADFSTYDQMPLTFSIWAYPRNIPAGQSTVMVKEDFGAGADMSFSITTEADGNFWWQLLDAGSGWHGIWSDVAPVVNNWYHLAFTVDAVGNMLFYINGAQQSWTTSTPSIFNSVDQLSFGANSGVEPWDGELDEPRFWSTNLSADWISTEYNNQNSPSTFITVGNLVLPIELLTFEATLDHDHVDLLWATLTEMDNDYFTLERSLDGVNFSPIAIIPGAGTSYTPLYYNFADGDISPGVLFYRLKQTDFNGDFSYSHIETVHIEGLQITSIYPNPAHDQITIVLITPDEGDYVLQLVDKVGRIVLDQTVPVKAGTPNYINLNTEVLESGAYQITAKTIDGVQFSQRQVVVR